MKTTNGVIKTRTQSDETQIAADKIKMTRFGMPTPLTTKALNRRALLKGVIGGTMASIGLPLLEAHQHRAKAQETGFPTRFGLFYWGNGNLPDRWRPQGPGSANTLWEPTVQLEPLSWCRDKVSVLTGLSIQVTNELPHFSGLVGSLCASPALVNGEDYTFPTKSVDQIFADHWGDQTRFRSVELAVAERYPISYLGPHQPLQPELSPNALFERIFGGGFRAPGEDVQVDPRVRLRRSVLDAVMEDQNRLMSKLGRADQMRLSQHLDSIRSLERQLARLEEEPPNFAGCSRPDQPVDATEADGRDRLAKTHSAFAELLALTLACDQTRVFTEVLTRPVGNYLFPTSSVGHHRLTHDEPGEQPEVQAVVVQIMERFSELIAALDRIPEGDGTLLDHTFLVGTSEISLGRSHSLEDIPFLIAGGGGARIKSGVHYHSAGGESTTSAWLSVMRAAGIRQAEWGIDGQRREDGLSGIEV